MADCRSMTLSVRWTQATGYACQLSVTFMLLTPGLEVKYFSANGQDPTLNIPHSVIPLDPCGLVSSLDHSNATPSALLPGVSTGQDILGCKLYAEILLACRATIHRIFALNVTFGRHSFMHSCSPLGGFTCSSSH
jgi:hypothetical protein